MHLKAALVHSWFGAKPCVDTGRLGLPTSFGPATADVGLSNMASGRPRMNVLYL